MVDPIQLQLSGDLKINEVYLPALTTDKRYLFLFGGAGSGKSYFIAQMLVLKLIYEPYHRILALRKVGNHVKKSVFEQLKTVIRNWNLEDHFRINYNEMTIYYMPFRRKNVSSQGVIHCQGLDDVDKVKSITDIDTVWMEEADQFEPEDFKQLNLRLRRDGFKNQIILSFNPTSPYSWLKEMMDTDDVDLKEKLFILKTTYKDNKFIPKEYCEELEKEKNKYLYTVYTLGEWGTREGVIYNPPEMCLSYPVFNEIIYGLDFGVADPTVLLRIGIKDQKFYVTELIYEPMNNRDLIKQMKNLNINSSEYIYCDHDVNRVDELMMEGYNCQLALKHDIVSGIDFVSSKKIISNPKNINFNKEIFGYSWDMKSAVKDKPIQKNDHAMDALRYAIFSHLAGQTEDSNRDRYQTFSLAGLGRF